MQLTSKVPSPHKNKTLIDYLTSRYTYLDRETWLERIAEGRFTYNDVLATADTVLRQGGKVVYDVPPFPQPDANFDYSVIFEDQWLVAVNKPANLRVHGEGRYMMANLSYHIRNSHVPPYPNLTLVNRLDADTSGVVLLAKDRTTAREMMWLFERKEVAKTYLALVHGIPTLASGVIDMALGHLKNPKYAKIGRVPRIGPNADKVKSAVTEYETLETYQLSMTTFAESLTLMRSLSDSNETEHAVSLVKLRPKTGRTHQLRVHMAQLNCPIVGDRLYMLDDERYVDWRENRQAQKYADLLNRHSLHSLETSFIHPHTKKTLTVSAPLAKDIQDMLDKITA
ncbi:MAG: RluA family pseudouridine synthase [Candidatus Promineifilaceae bacterium]